MAEWLVELRGHVFDLEHLAALFTAPLLLVVKDGYDYRLKSTEFDSLDSSAEVHAKAGPEILANSQWNCECVRGSLPEC